MMGTGMAALHSHCPAVWRVLLRIIQTRHMRRDQLVNFNTQIVCADDPMATQKLRARQIWFEIQPLRRKRSRIARGDMVAR